MKVKRLNTTHWFIFLSVGVWAVCLWPIVARFGFVEVVGSLIGLLFPIVTPVALWFWKKKAALVFACLYLLLYSGLSFKGRYVFLMPTSEEIYIWYPYGMENNTPSKTGRIKTEYPGTFGMFFWPLLVLDHLFVHRASFTGNK